MEAVENVRTLIISVDEALMAGDKLFHLTSMDHIHLSHCSLWGVGGGSRDKKRERGND